MGFGVWCLKFGVIGFGIWDLVVERFEFGVRGFGFKMLKSQRRFEDAGLGV